jgi:hypothetical protein
LKEHLSDVPPIELNFEVNVNAPVNKPGSLANPADVVIYELPVYEYGGNHKEQIEFLVNCDYDFFTSTSKGELEDPFLHGDEDPTKPSTPKLMLKGALLKKRE